MRAITLEPGKRDSLSLDEAEEPPQSQGPLLVRALAVGVCGTDHELVDGLYGAAAPGEKRLVLGHESLGRVVAAPAGSGFAVGDGLAGVLLEPASVLAKAWEHIERIGRRSRWAPQRVLEVHVFDRNKSDPKPALVEALGAKHRT